MGKLKLREVITFPKNESLIRDRIVFWFPQPGFFLDILTVCLSVGCSSKTRDLWVGGWLVEPGSDKLSFPCVIPLPPCERHLHSPIHMLFTCVLQTGAVQSGEGYWEGPQNIARREEFSSSGAVDLGPLFWELSFYLTLQRLDSRKKEMPARGFSNHRNQALSLFSWHTLLKWTGCMVVT